MDTNEQWEFCSLDFHGNEYHDDKKKNIHGWECGLTLNYIGKEVVKEKLCESGWQGTSGKMSEMYKQIWPINPWPIAIGLLGSMGWELVSIQHGVYTNLIRSDAIAYFRRPVKEGRNIDEPKFSLPFSPERI